MARRFTEPPAIQVLTEKGLPAHVVWRGQRQRVRVCNYWRFDQHWWKGKDGAVSREYYKLLASSGVVLVVYLDLVSEGWYLERIID